MQLILVGTWVLDFTSLRLNILLDDLGLSKINALQLALGFVTILAASMLLAYLFNFLKRTPKLDPTAQLWKQLQTKLTAKGLVIQDHLGPKDLLLLAIQRWPQHKNSLENIFQHYIQLRYGTANSKKQRLSLKNKIRKLRLKNPT